MATTALEGATLALAKAQRPLPARNLNAMGSSAPYVERAGMFPYPMLRITCH